MIAPTSYIDLLFPNRGKKLLFIHTPKCGGVFVGTALGRRYRHSLSVSHPALQGHLTWVEYRDALKSIGYDIGDFIQFTVIRDPWQWHLSWYNYIRKDKDGLRSGMPDEHRLLQTMSFIDYLRWLEDPMITGKPNQYYLKQISDWIIDEDGTVRIDDVVRQERLVEDLTSFGKKHGILLKIPKKRLNQSFEGDYRSAYCPEGVDIVARRHARDLAMFNYSFEG